MMILTMNQFLLHSQTDIEKKRVKNLHVRDVIKKRNANIGLLHKEKIVTSHDILRVAKMYDSVHAADSSIYITQDPRLTDQCLCTCCHEKNMWRCHCVIFKNSQYDLHSKLVLNALSARLAITTSREYICRSCQKYPHGQKPS